MSRVYTLVNQKGGVGKTTTAINLGAYLAYYGQKVLLVDLDPQSNATSSLKIDKNTIEGGTYEAMIENHRVVEYVLHNPKLKVSILPASPALAGCEVELVNMQNRESRLREAIDPIVKRYDYVIIDCPPSLGLLTLNGLIAAVDGVLIPVQCEYLALEGLGQLMHTINLIRKSYYSGLRIRGVLLTMFDGRTNLSSDVELEVRKFFKEKVFRTIIPRTVRLAEAPSYGQPISVYAPSSTGAIAYAALAREIMLTDGIIIPNSQE